MFQVLHLRRQVCQIDEDNRVAKNMGQEKDSEKERERKRGLKIKYKGGGGGGWSDTYPTSNQKNSFKSCLNQSVIFTANLHHISFCGLKYFLTK
jgi:hypothetical protein